MASPLLRWRFNGAADFHRRIASYIGLQRSLFLRFNGAADFHRRIVDIALLHVERLVASMGPPTFIGG